MLACLDVHYHGNHAVAAGLVFAEWTSSKATRQVVIDVGQVDPYVPGQFYRRELPCLRRVLAEIREPLQTILIDGYVWLDNGKPGLGAWLFDALQKEVPIVGVAKSAYRSADWAVPVLRGRSRTPLYVTAAGYDPRKAAEDVRRMHGRHRIPSLLRQVDRLCRPQNGNRG